jgi:hypothetical protein
MKLNFKRRGKKRLPDRIREPLANPAAPNGMVEDPLYKVRKQFPGVFTQSGPTAIIGFSTKRLFTLENCSFYKSKSTFNFEKKTRHLPFEIGLH